MQDYKPNSHRFKEEQRTASTQPAEKKEVQKVVKSPVKVKKKGPFSTAIDSFIQEDLTNIKTYIISDVIIPTIKNTIWDAFTNSLDMVLYGKSGHKRANAPGSSRVPYVSYNKYSDNRSNTRPSDEPRRGRYDFRNITFTSKADADEVLKQMDAIMDEYKLVTVVDFYDLVGITGEYTDSKYGWTNLRNAGVVRGRDGYYLEMPKPLPID